MQQFRKRPTSSGEIKYLQRRKSKLLLGGTETNWNCVEPGSKTLEEIFQKRT